MKLVNQIVPFDVKERRVHIKFLLYLKFSPCLQQLIKYLWSEGETPGNQTFNNEAGVSLNAPPVGGAKLVLAH